MSDQRHPCNPERRLWASDGGSDFSRRLGQNWVGGAFPLAELRRARPRSPPSTRGTWTTALTRWTAPTASWARLRAIWCIWHPIVSALRKCKMPILRPGVAAPVSRAAAACCGSPVRVAVHRIDDSYNRFDYNRADLAPILEEVRTQDHRSFGKDTSGPTIRISPSTGVVKLNPTEAFGSQPRSR